MSFLIPEFTGTQEQLFVVIMSNFHLQSLYIQLKYFHRLQTLLEKRIQSDMRLQSEYLLQRHQSNI